MFADDTNMLGHHTDISSLQLHIHDKLRIWCEWSQANKRFLNVLKSYYIQSTRKCPIPEDIAIKINIVTISRVKLVNLLGVVMDENLTKIISST